MIFMKVSPPALLIRRAALIILVLSAIFPAKSFARKKTNWKNISILFYTKNGKGYVHDNIPNSILAIRALSAEYGFKVDTTEDPSVFSDDNLKQYDAIVFSNTNNDVFDTETQRVAFMRYIQAGGGFVGIHSASGTERKWRWFKQLLGATFYWHDKFQPFDVIVLDEAHPSLKHLPNRWNRAKGDEFYFLKEMGVNLRILAVNDISTLKGEDPKRLDTFGGVFPSVWCQEFDGGRSWYTSLGHDKNDYFDPDFRKHILGGIEWVVGGARDRDYKKAYAKTSRDAAKNTTGK